MRWSADAVYQPVFNRITVHKNFQLNEHDYCFGHRKFAGNAQCLTRKRWVHHTSFLWDFSDDNMEALQLPEKRPQYREDRRHADFLTRIRAQVPFALSESPEIVDDAVTEHLRDLFDVQEATLEEALSIMQKPQERVSTAWEMV